IDAWNADAQGNFWSIGPALRSFNTDGDGLQDTATLSIGLRLPPELDVTRLKTRIDELAGDAEITVDGLQAGYRTTRHSKLVPPFMRGIRAHRGEPRFKLKLGTSDMNIVGPTWGCPIAAYGPGDSSLGHTPEERIDLDEDPTALRILRAVLTSF